MGLSLEGRSGQRPQHPLQQGTLLNLLLKAWRPSPLLIPSCPEARLRLNTQAGVGGGAMLLERAWHVVTPPSLPRGKAGVLALP